MKIRVSDIINDSIVDGKGIRLTIFAQGCVHYCQECHNPSTHDINGGVEVELEKIFKLIEENPLLDGVTLSGGEPFLQIQPCIEIAKFAREKNLNVWAYSGFSYEEIIADEKRLLLDEIDVLVDGKFDKALKSIELDFKGSSNQRIIDVKKSRKYNEIVEFSLEL